LHSLKARGERAKEHTQYMRRWSYEGGRGPTVKEMREQCAQDQCLDAWKDEHVVRPFLARHDIGEGLRLAAPERRRDRAMLAWQIKQREMGPLNFDLEALDLMPELRIQQIFTAEPD
jgi:hypothetical protein